SQLRAIAQRSKRAATRWRSSRNARRPREHRYAPARSRPLQRALVVDAECRVGNSLEPLLADWASTDAAQSIRAVVDAPEGCVDLDEEMLGVLLESAVDLA